MLRVGAMTTLQELRDHDGAIAALPALAVVIDGSRQSAVAGDGHGRRRSAPAAPGAGNYPPGASACWRWPPTAARWVADGDNRYHAIFPEGEARFVNPSKPGAAPGRARGRRSRRYTGRPVSAGCRWRRCTGAPQSGGEMSVRTRLAPGRTPGRRRSQRRRDPGRPFTKVRQRRALDWPLMAAAVSLTGSGNGEPSVRGSCWATPRPCPMWRRRRATCWPGRS